MLNCTHEIISTHLHNPVLSLLLGTFFSYFPLDFVFSSPSNACKVGLLLLKEICSTYMITLWDTSTIVSHKSAHPLLWFNFLYMVKIYIWVPTVELCGLQLQVASHWIMTGENLLERLTEVMHGTKLKCLYSSVTMNLTVFCPGSQICRNNRASSASPNWGCNLLGFATLYTRLCGVSLYSKSCLVCGF